LALCLKERGDCKLTLGLYDDAQTYFEKALEIQEKVYRPDHSEIGTITKDLGSIAFRKQNYPEAEKYFIKALNLFKKHLGEDHPFVGILYHGLSLVYLSQKIFEKALEFH